MRISIGIKLFYGAESFKKDFLSNALAADARGGKSSLSLLCKS